MSVYLNGTGDTLLTTLSAPLTIGTGTFSMGLLLRSRASQGTDALTFILAPDTTGSTPQVGLLFTTGQNIAILFGGGSISGTITLTQDSDYWVSIVRSGTTLTMRVFDMTGTEIATAITATDSTDYTSLDVISIGAGIGSGDPSFVGEVSNAKIQTGVAWSAAESWTEAQLYLIQKSGGTDRLAFRLAVLNDSTAGLHSCTGPGLLTNTGCVAGSFHPVALEYAPLASDDFETNNDPLPAPWTAAASPLNGAVKSLSGETIRSAAGTDDVVYYSGPSWPDDQWAECVVSATPDLGLFCRVQGNVAYGMNPGDVIRMAPTYTQIGASPGTTYAAGDVVRVEVTGASPTTITAYKNGVVTATRTDSSGPQSGGAAGLAAFNDNAGRGLQSWAGGRFGVPVTTLEQEGFQFYNDDGSESGMTTAAAQDTDITAPAATNKIFRGQIAATGDPSSEQFKVQFDIDGGSNWRDLAPAP